jgi:hypothetical protein
MMCSQTMLDGVVLLELVLAAFSSSIQRCNRLNLIPKVNISENGALSLQKFRWTISTTHGICQRLCRKAQGSRLATRQTRKVCKYTHYQSLVKSIRAPKQPRRSKGQNLKNLNQFHFLKVNSQPSEVSCQNESYF